MSRAEIPDAVTVWRPHDLAGLELMRSSRLAPGAGQPKHTQEDYELCVVEKGVGELWHRGFRQRNSGGCLVVIAPGQAHAGRGICADGLSLRTAHIAPSLMAEALRQHADAPDAEPNLADGLLFDYELAARFLALHQTLENKARPLLERQSCLFGFLKALVDRHGRGLGEKAPAAERAAVRRTREIMAERYQENISLHHLAGLAGFSACHFLRVFRAETGLTPHAFLTRTRILRAKSLLVRGIPAGQVAAEVGFFDQTHFNRHFKRLVGVNPGAYARHSKNVLFSEDLPSPYCP